MLEYYVAVAAIAGLILLYFRYLALRNRLTSLEASLESSLAETRSASTADLQSEVGKMIDELKSAADVACDQVAGKIEELKAAQNASVIRLDGYAYPLRKEKVNAATISQKPKTESNSHDLHHLIPIQLITRLADDGLSAMEIARRAKVGLAEVELTLKYRHNKRRSSRAAGNDAGYSNKEVGIA